jgi:nicotinamide-nucleotide amidase
VGVVTARTFGAAGIIAVGSELLTPARRDTNSLFITEQLNAIGIDVVVKLIIGDDRAELAHAIKSVLARVDVLVLCGGLGPTEDDVTREVAAGVLGRELREQTDITGAIRSRFAERGMSMPEINRRQAMVPDGAAVLPNPNGTAPGLWIETDGRVVVLLPGPPRELEPMMRAVVATRLTGRVTGQPILRRLIRVTGRSESHVEDAIRPLYAVWRDGEVPIAATILAALGQIELHLSARAHDGVTASAMLDRAVAQVCALLGEDVYSTDGRTMEEVVGGLLADRAWHIGVAESCTGGLITSRLTDVTGSSRYVDYGIISYSNSAKTELLDVSPALIAEHGAVSEPVALAMAKGVLARSPTNVGIGVTGIAGPGGGTPDKPVGTVAIAVVIGDRIRSRTARFMGERTQVKFQASQAALDMLRRMIVAL